MIDIVYPIGRGSQWNNMELKYSLRSVEKYLSGFCNIYIIGELPHFINKNKVKHFFFQDSHSNRERNIMEKFARACHEPELSKNFLFMNDDYFLCRPATSGSFFPPQYKGTLEETIRTANPDYARYLKATLEELTRRGLTTLNFDVHKPVLVNKNIFLQTVHRFDWSKPYGYTLKSILFNYPDLPRAQTKDEKINHPYTEKQWLEISKSFTDSFSIGDHAITFGLKKFLEAQFPDKSKFEL